MNHTAFCVNSVPFLFIFKEISDCKVLVLLTTFLLCPSLWAGLDYGTLRPGDIEASDIEATTLRPGDVEARRH